MDSVNLGLSWSNVLLGVAGYLAIIRLLRYSIRDGFIKKYPYKNPEELKKMSLQHAFEIQKKLFGQEFPFTAEKALQFALFRTYGIPTISKLLMQTKQFSSSQFAGKRYSDTEVLISEFMGNPPTHERTLNAIARMNYIHGRYQTRGLISNDDMLYTLSLFALEPVRWIHKYEWRKLSDLEITAISVFWKAQGDAMQIDMTPLQKYATEEGDPLTGGGMAWFQAIGKWSNAYEVKAMVPDKNNNSTAEETTKALLWDVPKVLHPYGRLAVASLMDERLRAAMMYVAPPAWLVSAVENTLRIRKYIIRYFFPPRFYYFRRESLDDEPDKHGRLHLRYYTAEPWYVRDTFWRRNEFTSWFKWLMGRPIPSKKFQPEGYMIPEVGPRSMFAKGQKEQESGVERLQAMKRAGCPFF